MLNQKDIAKFVTALFLVGSTAFAFAATTTTPDVTGAHTVEAPHVAEAPDTDHNGTNAGVEVEELEVAEAPEVPEAPELPEALEAPEAAETH